MSVNGIDRITFGVDDLAACRKFYLDWGLALVREDDAGFDFETLNGCEVFIRRRNDPTLPPPFEDGPTLREAIWGVDSDADLERIRQSIADQPGYDAERLGCMDPNGLAVRFRVSRKRKIDAKGVPINTWDKPQRIDARSAFYDRATPIEVGHLVFFTNDVAAAERFYVERVGFVPSDRYPGRGVFLRSAPEGGHHDLFLLQPPQPKRGLNHVAFAVRDVHEVFGGGIHISRCGWETEIGPGRHPISSAYLWYVKCPAGGLSEYYSDEDYVTADWKPQEFQPGPDVFAEWAVIGGIDPTTRRARRATIEHQD